MNNQNSKKKTHRQNTYRNYEGDRPTDSTRDLRKQSAVFVQNIQQLKYVTDASFSPTPVLIKCPHCNAVGRTKVAEGCGIVMTACLIPTLGLSCCMQEMKRINHQCSVCSKGVGAYEPNLFKDCGCEKGCCQTCGNCCKGGCQDCQMWCKGCCLNFSNTLKRFCCI